MKYLLLLLLLSGCSELDRCQLRQGMSSFYGYPTHTCQEVKRSDVPQNKVDKPLETHSEQFRKKFCDKLARKLGHRVTYKDMFDDSHTIKIAVKWEYGTPSGDHWNELNCIVYTEGSSGSNLPLELSARDYDDFYGLLSFLKAGRQ